MIQENGGSRGPLYTEHFLQFVACINSATKEEQDRYQSSFGPRERSFAAYIIKMSPLQREEEAKILFVTAANKREVAALIMDEARNNLFLGRYESANKGSIRANQLDQQADSDLYCAAIALIRDERLIQIAQTDSQ